MTLWSRDYEQVLQQFLTKHTDEWDQTARPTAPAARPTTDATAAMEALSDKAFRAKALVYEAQQRGTRYRPTQAARTLTEDSAAQLAAHHEAHRHGPNPDAPPAARLARHRPAPTTRTACTRSATRPRVSIFPQ